VQLEVEDLRDLRVDLGKRGSLEVVWKVVSHDR
jgi:hypothetical protein